MAIVWLVSCIFRLFQCKRASWRNNLRLLANQNTWFSSLVPLRLRQGRRTDSTKRSTLPSFLPFTFLRGFFRLAVPSLPHYRHSSAADCRSVAARSFRGLRLLHLEPRKFCGVRKPFVRDLTQPISPRRARGMRPRRGDFFLLPSLRRGRPSLHLHVLAQQGRVSPLSCLDRPTDRPRARDHPFVISVPHLSPKSVRCGVHRFIGVCQKGGEDETCGVRTDSALLPIALGE